MYVIFNIRTLEYKIKTIKQNLAYLNKTICHKYIISMTLYIKKITRSGAIAIKFERTIIRNDQSKVRSEILKHISHSDVVEKESTE